MHVTDELMRQYEERFDDIFPLMCCMGMTEDEINDEIRTCLESGRPFERIDGAIY